MCTSLKSDRKTYWFWATVEKTQQEILLLGLLFLTTCKFGWILPTAVLPSVLRKEAREDSVQKTDGYSAITYYVRGDSLHSGFGTVSVYSPEGVTSHSLLTSLECVLSHCDKVLSIKNARSHAILIRMLYLKYVVELSLDSSESD